MKISLDGFDNTIACSDLEVWDSIFIPQRKSGDSIYYVGGINREREYIFLCQNGVYMYSIKFDELVDINAFKLEKQQN